MNYKELISTKDRPSYSELLKCDEWQSKRKEIKIKNHNLCSICKTTGPHEYKPRLKGNLTYFVPVVYDIEEDQFGRQKIIEIEMDFNSELHVHHKYYVLTRLPWDYADEDLTLVCYNCHKNIHYNEEIICFKNEFDKQYFHLTPCNRCESTGYLIEYHYYQNGVCFQCNGTGYLELK